MENRGQHWPSILTLACVVPGAGAFLMGALALALLSLVTVATDRSLPTDSLITAGAAAFQGCLLLWLGWTLFQRARGDAASFADKPFVVRIPRGAAAGLAFFAIAAGALITIAGPHWASALLMLPLLTVIAVAAPLAEVCGWAASRIPLGARWRSAAMFGLGMTLAPLLIICVEIAVALVFVAVAAVVLASQPDAVRGVLALRSALESQTDMQVIAQLAAPYILKPVVLAAILSYVALIVPIVEELLKPLGVWLFARRIESAGQGFAFGALSGAAYGLVESLGVSGQGGAEWALAVAVRAATGLLHITNSALMGWAIVLGVQHRKYLHLAAMYVLVVLVHGIWNASAVGVAAAMLSGAAGGPDWLARIPVAAAAAVAVLLAGMLAILRTANKRLQPQGDTLVDPQPPSARARQGSN